MDYESGTHAFDRLDADTNRPVGIVHCAVAGSDQVDGPVDEACGNGGDDLEDLSITLSHASLHLIPGRGALTDYGVMEG